MDMMSDVLSSSDELYATVDGPTPNESDAASWQKVKDTPKRIFHEKVKNLDSSQSMNLADSSGIKTPKLVHLRNSPVNAYDEPRHAHVSVGVSDKDRGRQSKLRKSGGATATHDDQYRISEKERLKQLNEHIDFEIFKTKERDNMEREIIKRENIERENDDLKKLLIRLKTTRISKKETKVEERNNIKNIETRPETIDVPTRSKSVSHGSKEKFINSKN